jgi:hypothetical protein
VNQFKTGSSNTVDPYSATSVDFNEIKAPVKPTLDA